MRRFIILFFILLILPGFLMAQNFADAFRMSYNQIQGTARSAGMGNAFGALGGDFTSLSINPAGSAIYQSNELVFTPGYFINKSEMNIDGSDFLDNNQKFSFNNFGIVGSYKTSGSEAGIVNISYGIGYNRLANFNNSAFTNVDGSTVSWLDDIAAYANTESLSNSYLNKGIGYIQYRDWPTKLAWNNYLINPALDNQNNEIDGLYESILLQGEKVDQRRTSSQSGKLDEYVFNFAINFNHNFYIGTTVGLQDLRYKSSYAYEEDFENGGDLIFKDRYYLEGTGLNVKIGAIYKPVQSLRLGLSFHSPTFFGFNEESELDMQSSEQQEYVSPGLNEYNYYFTTPLKVVTSGAIVVNKQGLISVDAEFVDYSAMRFRRGGDGSDNFNDVNSVMGDNFKSVVNLRLGGEYKLTSNFALRAGYELYQNPFKKQLVDQSTLSDNVSIVSGGFGYSVNNFSLNVAYSSGLTQISDGSIRPNFHIPANDNMNQELSRKNTNQNVLISFGFRF